MDYVARVRLGAFTAALPIPNGILDWDAGVLTSWTLGGTAGAVTSYGEPTNGVIVAAGGHITQTIAGLVPGGAYTFQAVVGQYGLGDTSLMRPYLALLDPDTGVEVSRATPPAGTAGFFGTTGGDGKVEIQATADTLGRIRLRLGNDAGPASSWAQVLGWVGHTFLVVADSRNPDPDPAAGVWVLDDYRQSWAAKGDEWPAQPEPATASMRLAAVDQALLPPLEIGTPVSVTLDSYFGVNPGPLVAAFAGRISDAVARPQGAGLVVELTCVDYYADLRETYVGAAPWPQEYPMDRLDRIMEAVGLTWGVAQVWDPLDTFRALDVDHRPVADVLEDHLRQLSRTAGLLDFVDNGWTRAIVSPTVADGTWPPAPDSLPPGTVVWAQDVIVERASSGGPLVLGPTPAGVGAVVSRLHPAYAGAPPGTVRQVPADYVELSVEYRRDKGQATNRAEVTGTFDALVEPAGTKVVESFSEVVASRGPVVRSADSTFAYAHSARALARMLLGNREDLAGRWAVESFTLHAHRLTEAVDAALTFPLFPSHEYGYAAAPHPIGAAVVVYGVQPWQVPNGDGREWIGGQLAGADLSVKDGKVLVTAHLRPSIPRAFKDVLRTGANNDESLTWEAMALVQGGAYAATGWDDLAPSLTWEDLRVTRSE